MFEADQSYPYALVLELARVFFTCIAGSSPATDDDLRELVRLLPDLALQFPDVASNPQARTPDPEQEGRRLFTLLTRLFTDRAARQPLLVVVEDAHWCDESSLEFLLALARRCAHQPIFLLFTHRTEDSSPVLTHWLAQLERERLTLDLALRRLSLAETADMAQAILSASYPLDAALVADLYALTEGNPFFVEEALKSLIATGELRQMDGAWIRRSDTRHASGLTVVPMSVQDTVRRRVARLSGEARQALTLAAVAGRRFDFALLQEALHLREDQLIPLMKELIAAQLVVEEAPDQFAFRHALTREAIYSQLLARERRSLHRILAEALAALSPSPSLREAHLTDLARHSYAAGAWAQALEYEARAGEKALALYAPRAAVEHLNHAVDSAHQADITVPGAIYLARGQAHETLGDFERARDDYESARDAAQVAADGALEWQSMMALGFLWSERDYAQAGAWLLRARDLAGRLGDQTLQARSLNRIGNWLVNTGRIEEGLQAHQDALGLFEEQHDTQGIAETLDSAGDGAWHVRRSHPGGSEPGPGDPSLPRPWRYATFDLEPHHARYPVHAWVERNGLRFTTIPGRLRARRLRGAANGAPDGITGRPGLRRERAGTYLLSPSGSLALPSRMPAKRNASLPRSSISNGSFPPTIAWDASIQHSWRPLCRSAPWRQGCRWRARSAQRSGSPRLRRTRRWRIF